MTYSTLYLDESFKNNVLTLAGFVAPSSQIPPILETWRALKTTTFGVDPDLELKYTLPQDHPSRGPLDDAGWPQAQRVPALLDCIARMELLVLADTLLDVRATGSSPTIFYLDALDWCIQRFGMEVAGPGPHWVEIDMPPQPDLQAGRISDRLRELWDGGGTAAFDLYREIY